MSVQRPQQLAIATRQNNALRMLEDPGAEERRPDQDMAPRKQGRATARYRSQAKRRASFAQRFMRGRALACTQYSSERFGAQQGLT